MSKIIEFPGRVDPPCECEDGTGAPEGYKLKHFEKLGLPDPNAEPTSSNPFPWVNIITSAEDCIARVQVNHESFIDIPLDEAKALDMIAELSLHVRRSFRRLK